MNRRRFVRAGLTGAVAAAFVRDRSAAALAGATSAPASPTARAQWVTRAVRVGEPVLTHLAAGTLRARMPVEQAAGADRAGVTHLEAVGRLLAGIAPWLDLERGADPQETSARARLTALAQQGLDRALDPASPDALVFDTPGQPLVDAAFLVQALLRAPRTLLGGMSSGTRARLVAALESTRATLPGFSNWLLFTAMVEVGLRLLGARWDRVRVDYALRQHDGWYKGDGAYGDGPAFHWDYYNSFVIHPMLVDVLSAIGDELPIAKDLRPRQSERALRYAAVQERMIAADGSFPALGRSLAYRCGAFHLLAQAALRRTLPPDVTPAQVRGALGAVIARTLDAPGTFDAGGWLQIGLCGHQPGVGERYISTGSLYLCATAFLPLGLADDEPFWTAPDDAWTAVRAWSGEAFPIDHALG